MPVLNRPSLPHRNSCHSLPATPYAHDRFLVPRDMDESLAMQHARIDLGGDYFGAASTPHYDVNCGGHRSRSPCKRCERKYDEGVMCELSVQEAVRRQNLAAALANSQIPPRAPYAQIHPMMTSDRRYPNDFSLPLTMNSFRSLDGSQLDRILTTYRLPLDHSFAHSHSHTHSPSTPPLTSKRNPYLPLTLYGDYAAASPSESLRLAKISALLEFLGAARVREYERERARKEGWRG
ncbi:MAG: hypothetical protein M1817_000016 [Caeruleum heppii]|nr:MAG: hypothetical protein M1817_000016 [Caeruleum heppii]